MNKIVRDPDATLSRRAVLEGAAGLTFAFSIPTILRPAAALAQGDSPASIGAWVTISPDGAIVVAVPAAEMGQGSLTGLAMIFAEEMDADWSRVTTTYPPVIPSIFGNPVFGGLMVTYGSGSVRGYWDKIRLQAAAVRRVLMQAAADRWQVPLGELHTEPNLVVHAASHRSMSYGEIASFAQVPATMPTIDKAELKKTADYRILGKTTPRFDIPAKTDGSAQYAIDVQIPNMVYATVLRAPVEGAVAEGVDDAAALAVPGVLRVVPLGESVGVVAESVEAAFSGRATLRVTWSKTPTDNYSSADGLKDFLTRAGKLEDKGVSFFSVGDTDSAFAKAAKVVSAQYTTEYVYHAQMEPMNVTATVSPSGDSAEIWVGTQGPSIKTAAAATILKTTTEKIKLNQLYLGGGYGRRWPADTLPEVLPLAKLMQRPVKLIWTREQDVKSAKMRPMTAHRVEAALDAAGKVIGWRHRVVAESIIAYINGEKALDALKGLDIQVLKHATHEYDIANQSILWLREKRGVGLCSWRGIGAGYHKFAIESFIDELAAAQNVEPVQFRLGLLEHEPRAQAVIRAVAEKSGWGKPMPDGHELGFAYASQDGTYHAAVGEISLDRKTGIIRAHRFWVALDPGIAVNPDSIVAQAEGGMIFGLSGALKEQVSISAGRVQQNNFYDYPVLRMSEIPEIDVQIIATDNPPQGIGEAFLPLVAPCLANALFRLTGKRFRALPFSPQRIKKEMAST
jgi:isoquinoline 1-oxidoreductase subunit beta